MFSAVTVNYRLISSLKLCNYSIRYLSQAKFENHYEILNLKKDCSNQDIKDSFIKLSKKYHPDKTDIKDYHRKFIKVNEAYNVLSKPYLRRQYDSELSFRSSRPSTTTYGYGAPYSYQYRPVYNRARNNYQNFDGDSYYGIKGVRRFPNGLVVSFFLTILGIMTAIEFSLIRLGFETRRERVHKENMRLLQYLQQLQDDANENGNKVQMEKMRTRMNRDEPKFRTV